MRDRVDEFGAGNKFNMLSVADDGPRKPALGLARLPEHTWNLQASLHTQEFCPSDDFTQRG
jgi:hypothetical protein